MPQLLTPKTPPPSSAYDYLQRDLSRMSAGMKRDLVFYDYDGEKLYFETMDDYSCEVRGWIPMNLQEGFAIHKLAFPALLSQIEDVLLRAVTNPSQL